MSNPFPFIVADIKRASNIFLDAAAIYDPVLTTV